MTARPFVGLRVVLVAAFNRRYHRTGYALERALASLGCEVRCCEERRRGWTALFGRPLADRLARRLARRPADVVLVFKGTALHPETTRDLKRRFGGQWVNWFPDDPHEHATALGLSPAYDRFFTHDSASVAGHRQAGARAEYLAFGCDADFLRPLPARRRWTAPIVFVGSRDPVREHVMRELAAFGLVAHGPGWPNGPVYGKAFVHALAGAAVGLNVHQHFGEAGDPTRYGTGANMRVFELAAVGTAQLADAKADIARHLSPGREIVLYRSVSELRESARALLDNAALRHSLGLAARARALREHTWSHRLEELLTITLR